MFLVMVYCYLAITLLMTLIKIKLPRDLRETSILKFLCPFALFFLAHLYESTMSYWCQFDVELAFASHCKLQTKKFFVSYDVTVIQWITSYHKNRMTTPHV